MEEKYIKIIDNYTTYFIRENHSILESCRAGNMRQTRMFEAADLVIRCGVVIKNRDSAI